MTHSLAVVDAPTPSWFPPSLTAANGTAYNTANVTAASNAAIESASALVTTAVNNGQSSGDGNATAANTSTAAVDASAGAEGAAASHGHQNGSSTQTGAQMARSGSQPALTHDQAALESVIEAHLYPVLGCIKGVHDPTPSVEVGLAWLGCFIVFEVHCMHFWGLVWHKHTHKQC